MCILYGESLHSSASGTFLRLLGSFRFHGGKYTKPGSAIGESR